MGGYWISDVLEVGGMRWIGSWMTWMNLGVQPRVYGHAENVIILLPGSFATP